jgi:hypothetical protein
MNPRERILAVLAGKIPDRVPRFEVWIDGMFDELGVSDPYRAYVELGQDAILMPYQAPQESNAWKEGVDEFGRVWKKGMYYYGAVKTPDDLQKYTPPLTYAENFFDGNYVGQLWSEFPEHFYFFGTHIGPFMATYMAMGMEHMFRMLRKDSDFVHAVMEERTNWALAIYKRAVSLGAEMIVMGDDSAHRGGPMISPQTWRELVLPYHQRITRELSVPVIWHSDGKMDKLLPFAVEAGFAGVHGLETLAGNKLDEVKKQYDGKLVLMGNVDINLFFEPNFELIRADVERSYAQSGKGGYMISSCNSIYAGMNSEAVLEYFRCQATASE